MSAVLKPVEMLPDMSEAARFLDFVAEGEPVTFQTFDDDPDRKDRALATVLHGDLTAHGERLRAFNARGAGIFWTVNYTDGAGRKAENITGIRAVFIDLDGAPLAPVLTAGLDPHAVVESSSGKWHAYWLVTGCTREQFKPVQQALAARFGGDRSVCDLPRVLRVPGFVHRKCEPFRSRFVSLEPVQPYDLPELVQRLGLDLAPKAEAPHADPETGEIADKVQPGGRHAHLVKWAAQLNWRGMPAEAVRVALHAENMRACSPPKTQAEVDAIVRDILARYSGQHGRDAAKRRSDAELAAGLVAHLDAANEDDTDEDEDEEPHHGPPTTLMSEDAMALDFANMAQPEFRWSPGLDWLRDDGIVWTRDLALRRYTLAREVARATARQAVAATGKESDARKIATAKSVNAILSLAQSDPRLVVPAAAWDEDPLVLNTPGGIVDLRTGALRQRGKSEYVTQAARVAPAAGPCPTWLRFLDQVFMGDRYLIEFIRRALGYSITGDRREQVLFFWHGSGANGKSVLVDLVQWLAGDYALKLPATVLMQSKGERHPTELAQLRGKRLAVSSELDESSFFNEALIKELTGDEVLTARFMRQDFFEFSMSQKHIIVGNFKPRLKGGDPAIARRMLLVPFLASFKGSARDPHMLVKLKAEAPAILHWIVGGAADWAREGLAVPESVRAASADYMADHDDLALWLAECCERQGEAKAGDLYASFSLWKKARGEHAPSMTSWCSRLASLPGVKKRKTNGAMVYEGVALTYAEHETLSAARRGF